jgi:transcriptional regulator with XRE-family HTH domain
MAKRAGSVPDLLRKINIDKETRKKVEKEIGKKGLAKFLFVLRCQHKLTQKQLAEKIGVTQSKISKLESAYDNEITIQDLLTYANALDLQLEIGYRSKSIKIVDLIKYHAFRIKKYLESLSKLAGDDETLAQSILKFHEETLFNMVQFIAESGSQLKISQKKSRFAEKEHIHISPPFEMREITQKEAEIV